MKERVVAPMYREGAEFYTAEQLKSFAQRHDLRRRVAQALLLTGGRVAPGSGLEPDGIREYGFVGYHLGWTEMSNLFLHFTPIFKGKEEEISLMGPYKRYIEGRYVEDLARFNVPVLFFHTHPELPRFSNILRFSADDLRGFANRTNDDSCNPGLIEGVGTDWPPLGEKAQLLLIALKDDRSYQTFDPNDTYRKSVEYIKAPGKHPYDAYREVGLHIAHTVFSMREAVTQEHFSQTHSELHPRSVYEATPAVSSLVYTRSMA